MRSRTFIVVMRCECVKTFGSRVGRVVVSELDVIVEDACCAFPGAYVSIAYHAISFDYVCGSFFVLDRVPDSIESVMVCVACEVSSTKGVGAGWFRVQHHWSSTEKISRFSS